MTPLQEVNATIEKMRAKRQTVPTALIEQRHELARAEWDKLLRWQLVRHKSEAVLSNMTRARRNRWT